MSKTSHLQRVFILTMVVVFFLSAMSLTGYVIWQQYQDNKAKKKTADIQTALNKAKESSSDTSKEQSTKKETTKLEGTKLENFTPIEKVTELQKIDTVVGTGEEVKPGDTVTAHYTGALAKDGTIFQSSHDSGSPIPFSLNQVIKGWTDGVPGMKVGGKRRLIIPAEQAYGASSPSANIPANSDLVFDIELVKIGQ